MINKCEYKKAVHDLFFRGFILLTTFLRTWFHQGAWFCIQNIVIIKYLSINSTLSISIIINSKTYSICERSTLNIVDRTFCIQRQATFKRKETVFSLMPIKRVNCKDEFLILNMVS